MKTLRQSCFLAFAIFAALVLAIEVSEKTSKDEGPYILTFDVPDAGTAPGEGTTPQDTNDAGEITGYYLDAQLVFHV